MNTKLQRIKETLKSVLSQFQSERLTSDKGVIDVQKAGDEIGTDTPEEREEAPAEEEEKPAEEEAPEEEPAAEEEAPAQEEENAEVAALRAEIAEKDARIAELEARIAELEKKPAAEPATEEFKKVNKITKTGNEKLDRLAKIMGA